MHNLKSRVRDKFFVFGLPRSRTYWLSQFLQCTHDGLYFYPDYQRFLDGPSRGDCSTMYPWTKDLIPENSRKVVIERDVEECHRSFEKALWPVDIDLLYETKEELDKIEGLRIPFNEINDRLEEIWNYCRIGKFNNKRAEEMKSLHLEDNTQIQEIR
jgi:hypothetical protein